MLGLFAALLVVLNMTIEDGSCHLRPADVVVIFLRHNLKDQERSWPYGCGVADYEPEVLQVLKVNAFDEKLRFVTAQRFVYRYKLLSHGGMVDPPRRSSDIRNSNGQKIALNVGFTWSGTRYDRAVRELDIQARVLGSDERFKALGSSLSGLLRPPSRQGRNDSSYETQSDLGVREMVKPLSGVGLPDIGDRRDSVAVVLGLMGFGAALGGLIVSGVWLMDDNRRVTGGLCLLLACAGYGLLWWLA